ncbi:MAG: hypothetical protein ACYDH0_09670 [Candidatus Aminicenantales bacterium]
MKRFLSRPVNFGLDEMRRLLDGFGVMKRYQLNLLEKALRAKGIIE